MTKYRIVKLNNGKYGVQEKWSWLMGWYLNSDDHDTIEQAREYIKWWKEQEIKKKIRLSRKVMQVIE